MFYCVLCFALYFFFTDTATTEIYTLSLLDALPICFGFAEVVDAITRKLVRRHPHVFSDGDLYGAPDLPRLDRKSTRLNSRHVRISYAVFCLKKKKITWTISDWVMYVGKQAS